MRTSMSRFLILILALGIFTPAAFAQFSQRGAINGVVAEPSGAVVASAPVSLLDLNRNQTAITTTDATGHYSFSQLLPGDYQVTVDFTGFTKSVSAKLSVSPQADVRCDI